MKASAVVSGPRAVAVARAAGSRATKVAMPMSRPASIVRAPGRDNSVDLNLNSARRGGDRAARVIPAAGFDETLAAWADKFEKSENKVAVAGWVSLAAFAYFHLLIIAGKGLIGGFFVGFPLEALGALSLFVVIPRYVLDGKDAVADAGEVVKDVAKRLPGL